MIELLAGTEVVLVHQPTPGGVALRRLLQDQGCRVHWYAQPELGAQFARERRPDIVLLDEAAASGGTGPVLARCHSEGWVAGCLVLAEQGPAGIAGLHAGADDYLLKPVDPDELVARMVAILRRAGRAPASARKVRADARARCALVDGRPVKLTAMEWTVLELLAARPGRIFGRSEIEDAVTHAGHGEPQSNSLEVIVSRLRKKLGAGVIQTHRSQGYSFRAEGRAGGGGGG